MKKHIIRIVSILLSFCCFLSIVQIETFTNASDINIEDRDIIEQRLAEIDDKLSELNKDNTKTIEHLNILNEKLELSKKQYSNTQTNISELKKQITNLNYSIEENNKEIISIQEEISDLETKINLYEKEFNNLYKAYTQRLKALYISGGIELNYLMLLESNSIEQLLTRYQLIYNISKRDSQLLEDIKNNTEKVTNLKNELTNKQTLLETKKEELNVKKNTIEKQASELSLKETELVSQQKTIQSDQENANDLLKEINDQTKEYGEYRDITQEELDAIDREIETADKKYDNLVTSEPEISTTTQLATTQPITSPSQPNTTTKPNENIMTTTTQPVINNQKYINLTYPCPSYTTITCNFGDYFGHTGCDFSTQGNSNQKIVAAESGTVILVRWLETSYGHYIVIKHDKTTKSGNTVYTLYAHNNNMIVHEGQYVTKGQQIAYSGSTGNSTGPHCHFEVRVGGSSQYYAVDPKKFL